MKMYPHTKDEVPIDQGLQKLEPEHDT